MVRGDGVRDLARCPDCGGELGSGGASAGLCPRCLLSLALVGSVLEAEPDAKSGVDTEAPTLDGPAVGQILGERYQMRELLGRGGMGEVWRAFDLKLRVDVALKSVRPELVSSEKARELLRQEVRAAREVVSPNVCRIFDLEVAGDQELVSMEYIDGTTLAATLRRRGPLELKEAREIASQFLSGLEAIHQAGLVHRDFKPENVMLTRAGRVVVMDFGLARGLGGPSTGTVAGTPAYMAPEQARGEGVDARADVFAAGVVLAEMLTVGGGAGIESRQALWQAVRESPPQVPEGPWASALGRALDPRPEARYSSARALAHALEEVTLRLPGFEEKRPYPGLASFTEEDAEYFFGREAEVEAIWKKLKRPRLLALIGPSGTGKSSFVRAGLLPTLPPSWAALVTTPGPRPHESLAQALIPSFSGDTAAMRQFLRFEEASTAVELVSRWRRRHENALLVVDQFEELFTLNPPETQASFAALLGRLVLEADVHVLLSLRDDFLFHCHAHEALAPILNELTLLTPLSDDALRRALVQPALACGYRFEDEALVETMVEEVGPERGALPLLAFAASRLWERRDRERGLLTREAYAAIGGVAGALAQHAEATLERIGTQRTPLVREIFRNLVTAQGTRAARAREDLLSVFDEKERAEADEVLAALVDARLLTTFDRPGDEAEGRHQEIEIAHESLLSRWPRLVRWQTQDADGALLRDQLRQAAQLWEDKGRSADLLWSGTAFREFELWRERYPGQLTAREADFARSMAARAQRRRRLRTAAVASVILALAGVAIAVGVSRQHALESARRAEASKLVALAQARLAEDPTEALALATASLELADTREARVFAVRALWEGPPVRELEMPGGSYTAGSAGFSPDGHSLAVCGFSPEVRIWAKDGTSSLLLSGLEQSQFGYRCDWTSTELLVVGLVERANRVRVWVLPETRPVRTIDLGGESHWQVGPHHLFAETTESRAADETPKTVVLRSWRLPDGEPEVLGRVDRAALGVSSSLFEPSGRGWLYSSGGGDYLRSFPFSRGRPDRLLARREAEVRPWYVYPSNPERATSEDESGDVRLWSFDEALPRLLRTISRPDARRKLYPEPSGQRVAERDGSRVLLSDVDSWPGTRPLGLRRSGYSDDARLGFSFHPDGDWFVAATHRASHLTFWPVHRPRPIVVDVDGVYTGAFSRDGRWLAMSDGITRVWPLPGAGSREVRTLDLPEAVDLAFASGDQLLFGARGGSPFFAPLDGSPPRLLEPLSEGRRINAVAVSPSGHRVATATFHGTGPERLAVWDLETGDRRLFELPKAASNEAVPGPGKSAFSGSEGLVTSLHFVDETTLYTAGMGGVRRWNLGSGAQEVLLPADPEVMTFMAASPGGHQALVKRLKPQPGQCEAFGILDLDSGTTRELPRFGDCPSCFALDASGSVVVTGDFDGLLRVGRPADEEPHLLFGHDGALQGVAISPDLRWIASAGTDDTLRLWPMPDLSRPPLHTLPHAELLDRLRSLTNLRAARDPASSTGWTIELDPFPGWAEVPEW